jgi:hypothetical protein
MSQKDSMQNRSSRILPVVVRLALLSLLFLTRIIGWPLTVEFTDWRLDAVFGCALASSVGITLAFFARTRRRPWIRAFLGWSGVAFSIASLFLLLIELQGPTQQLQTEYTARSEHYRLYMDQSGGMFMPPFAVLKREWGPVFGVKLTREVWGNVFYCCDLEIKSLGASAISVVDRQTGKSVFSMR